MDEGECLFLFLFFILFKKYIILFLAASGLSCGKWDLSLQHACSVVAVWGLQSAWAL